MNDSTTHHVPDYRFRERDDLPLTVQQFLMRSGVASRRGAAALMREGRVRVNSETVYTFALKIDPLLDTVYLDDQPIPWRQKAVTLILYKPWDTLTTMFDPYNRPCVAGFIPKDQYPGLYPLGRLDKDTTGVLIFSTDGQLGRYLLQPKYHVEKTYLALVDGIPTDHDLQSLCEGIELDDGLTAPAQAYLLHGEEVKRALHDFHTAFVQDPLQHKKLAKVASNEGSFVSLSIHEGRMHQVKRMMHAVGHEVLYLHRQSFAGLTTENLQPGQWRILDHESVEALKSLG